MKRLLIHLAMLPFIALIGRPHAAQVNVFAAASLTDALKEIAAVYEPESGDKLVFNFAGSGLLARQIEEGAPADLFISADEAKMDGLEKNGRIRKESRRTRLSNSLVCVVPNDSPLKLPSASSLATEGVKRLAIGEPRTVPAGAYAKDYLTKQGLWTNLEKKVIPCESVRAVLAAVESGNVEVGIVYRTDAAISKKTRVAFEVPREQGPLICYPMALVKESRQPAAAQRLLEYLGGDDAGRVFRKLGFVVLPTVSEK